jgi:xanthine dehydrogenase accessory factor
MTALEARIAELLAQGEDLVLATVLETDGSAPRGAGARMAVRNGGRILGTIGGGSIEAAAIEVSLALFQSRDAVIRTFELDQQGSLGMICGGRMTVLMEHLPATPQNVTLFRELSVPAAGGGVRVGVVPLGEALGGRLARLERMVVDCGESAPLAGSLPAALTERLAEDVRKERSPFVLQEGGRWYLLEPVFHWGTVFLFGAGHVALATAALAKTAGFRTVVLDDRGEFASRERYPTADEVRVIDSFDRAMEGLTIDPHSYLVIVTRGHRHDRTVLAQSLRTRATYVGMIGSLKKRDQTYQSLRQEGFGEDDFRRVHCPIGLAIHADTPEEIAVSIVGELIQHRNAPAAGRRRA